jgi:hypothetical protein
MEPGTFHITPNLISRGERRKKCGRGKNLCSLHECVANKSSFSMTNYYEKRWKMRKYCRQREIRAQWRRLKVKAESFLLRRDFSRTRETLNQLISRGRVEKHKFNSASSPLRRMASAWRQKYQESIFRRFLPPLLFGAHTNCRTFFIIERREYCYEEISLFYRNLKENEFLGWKLAEGDRT